MRTTRLNRKFTHNSLDLYFDSHNNDWTAGIASKGSTKLNQKYFTFKLLKTLFCNIYKVFNYSC